MGACEQTSSSGRTHHNRPIKARHDSIARRGRLQPSYPRKVAIEGIDSERRTVIPRRAPSRGMANLCRPQLPPLDMTPGAAKVYRMDLDSYFTRYQELQRYVGWTDEDARCVAALVGPLEPSFGGLIDDFYDEISRHPDAHKVITGGDTQINRLKRTLLGWLGDLFSGKYDREYVARRWRIGRRHTEIGLDQTYTNVALARLRSGLTEALATAFKGESGKELNANLRALHKLLDLDLAIIEDAYQSEHLEQRQRVERLATIGHIASGVAHELRQPLNVIGSSIYYLRNAKNPSAEKTEEHYERIHRQVALANRVITAMSNFAKMPAPDVVPVSLVECVRDTLESTRLPGHIDVLIDCSESLPAVMADPDQLRIVFANLIRNARDALDEGGRLTITGRENDQGVELTFDDTGQGIPPAQLARIMEPLYTTKARGIGLGLAIAKGIVEKHSGHISVSSRLGLGTTFRIILPRSLTDA